MITAQTHFLTFFCHKKFNENMEVTFHTLLFICIMFDFLFSKIF